MARAMGHTILPLPRLPVALAWPVVTQAEQSPQPAEIIHEKSPFLRGHGGDCRREFWRNYSFRFRVIVVAI
jgi:hypothetical protein